MKARVDGDSVDVRTTNQWYQAALWSAVVAAVFSLIVVVLLVVNYLQIKVFDPVRAERLELLKLKILDHPDDVLLLQIRKLDLKIRQDRIRRHNFSYKGSFLLIGGLAVFVISAKVAAAFKKKPPEPQALPDRQNEQVRQAIRARWTITVGLAALGAAVLFFATRPVIDYDQADAISSSYPSMEEVGKNWPRFRGPGGLGISASTNVPNNWNGSTGEGILWKSKVPLPGHNSPIVWGDRVFLSGADANVREVYCFDALSGNLLWHGNVPNLAPQGAEPVEPGEDTGFAAPTMVTDGRRVYAIFATGDIGCFDFYGRTVWARNLGPPDSAYGYASSLAMYRDLLLIQYDQGGVEDEKSKLIALNAFLGHTVWEKKRPVPNSWASPIVAEIGNQHQIITCGDPWVIAYNPANGAELWRAKCVGGDIAPSPIYAGGLIFAIEPYTKLVAIRPDGHGDVTKTHIAWSIEEAIPDICSPVSNDELIFLLTTDGLLSCCKVTDATLLWEEELEEDFRASPGLLGNRLYLLSEKGVMFIIEAGTEYKELARCELGERCHASPAFADGRIYIRGLKNLYCIGN